MGSFIQSKKKNPPQSKGSLSKGERKGWIDKSQYVAVPINTIKWESKKIEVYSVNRYGLPKIVP